MAPCGGLHARSGVRLKSGLVAGVGVTTWPLCLRHREMLTPDLTIVALLPETLPGDQELTQGLSQAKEGLCSEGIEQLT